MKTGTHTQVPVTTWDRYLSHSSRHTQVPVPTAILAFAAKTKYRKR